MKSPKKVRNDRRTQYIEDITRWHEKIKFISSSRRVMFGCSFYEFYEWYIFQ